MNATAVGSGSVHRSALTLRLSRAVFRVNRSEAGTHDLVCFSGAGESATRFLRTAQHLDPQIGLLLVERPGNGLRVGEELCASLDTLSREIAYDLANSTTRRLVLLGHSVGSLVAFAVAKVLSTLGLGVEALVACNGRSPVIDKKIDWLDLDDIALASELARLRDVTATMFARADVVEHYIPIVRADLSLYDWAGANVGTIDTPVVAIGCRDDRLVAQSEVLRWSAVARDEFVGLMVPGDHSVLIDEPNRVVGAIDNAFEMIKSNTRLGG